MSRFNYVEVWPPTGFPDAVWNGREGHPVQDAFLRSARCVTELYSEGLSALDVDGYKSMLRITCGWDPTRPPRDVLVGVLPGKPYDFPGEMGFIHIPAVVGRHDAHTRARIALTAVHASVLQLAELRGWDPAQFEACFTHVIDNDFVYRWDSPWKASPGRHFEARARFRLGSDDGFGRVHLEVRSRGTAGPGIVIPEAVAFCTSEGFKRSARSLRWGSATQVGLLPYWGLGPPSQRGLLSAEVNAGDWTFERRDDVRVRQPGGEGVDHRGDPDVYMPDILTVTRRTQVLLA